MDIERGTELRDDLLLDAVHFVGHERPLGMAVAEADGQTDLVRRDGRTGKAVPELEALEERRVQPGQDPDDLLKGQGPDAVRAVVEAAQPLSEMLWQRALAGNDRSTPERRAQFERDLRSAPRLGERPYQAARLHEIEVQP